MATIVFDFDGTIADSLQVAIKIYRDLTGDQRALTKAEFNKLRKQPAQKVIRILGIPMWRLPILLLKGRKRMFSAVDEVQIFSGLDEVLKALQHSGQSLYILSSNSTKNVTTILKKHDLLQYFTAIQGGVGLFTKTSAIKRLARRNAIPMGSIIYVGDEARDIVSAQRAGVPIISVTWGYNDRALLKTLSPDYIADTPQELQTIIQNIR